MADLTTKICGIEFPNPIFTAAGPTASDAAMLKRAVDGGAGGLVTKTISIEPAKVPIPNIFSPFPGSLMNAELWSEMDYRKFIAEELPKIQSLGRPVIASVGYSPEDLAVLGREIEKSQSADAVEFSIHYIGKDVENLKRTAAALKENTTLPVFAKFSPSILDLPLAVKTLNEIVDGYVAINSVGPALDFDVETLQPYLGSSDGRGWLSGRAILPIGLHFVAAIYELTDKPIIGVGGVRNSVDALKYILAGASAVQISTHAILKGQNVYGKIASDLENWMDKHGFQNLESLIGAFHRREKHDVYIFQQGKQLRPAWEEKYCNLCMICVKSCVHEAITFIDDKFTLDEEKCVSCGLCASVCPRNALEMK